MRTKSDIEKEIARLKADERLALLPASTFSNAPLALMQVSLKERIVALEWVLEGNYWDDAQEITMSRLFDKYKIEKTDGSPIDPNAMYFVLRIDTDFHARVALRAYARSIRSTDPDFANELDKWIENRPTSEIE